ncbi:hypothetical protein AAD001_02465 [Colwelliaceae bacterium 6471]
MAINDRDPLIERRELSTEQQVWWDKLSLAQKFSASNLSKYGYDLAFVRNSNSGSLAVLLRDGQSTTISDDGEIDTHPNIVIRP